MKPIIGKNRFQAFTSTLEERIASDNPVRVINAFVEVLPLEKMGFSKVKPVSTGRPPYEPKHLLNLFLYGYYNRIRSSRKLAVECVRNIELHWLIQGPYIESKTKVKLLNTFRPWKKRIPGRIHQRLQKKVNQALEQLHTRKLKYETLEV